MQRKGISHFRSVPRQVQQLKERRDKEGVAAMDADQRKKIAGEGELLAEIAALGE